MGFFEENPIVFIVAVVLIVEIWTFVKNSVGRYVEARRSKRAD
jgi:hypothetical protein